jgi:hypothetical protein
MPSKLSLISLAQKIRNLKFFSMQFRLESFFLRIFG